MSEDTSVKVKPAKKIILKEDGHGNWTSVFKCVPGHPITLKDMRLLDRILKVGFRKYQYDFRLAKRLREKQENDDGQNS